MASHDVIIIHPPALYDFRKMPIFSGAMGSSVEQVQFNKVPIGSLSIADYLDRHGFRVMIDNLCDRMVNSRIFDVEAYLGGLNAKVFAIGLHFQQHSQGALEIARLCKKLHPDSLVVIGGLTATRFHDEIIRDYHYVDAVVRGEGEKALLALMQNLSCGIGFAGTPNLTFRNGSGETVVNPMGEASSDLDEFEFTRFDLIEPKSSIFPKAAPARWSLTVCRGCLYNCAICGGSAYSYDKYLAMKRPAFRSPRRLISDIKKLNDQGIFTFGIYQDPRMGGREYWQELLAGLKDESLRIDQLSLDLLATADEEYIRAVAGTGRNIVMHLCPDTGCNDVRKKLGRHYTNDELLKTVALCHSYSIPVTTFFSVGLADEGAGQIEETKELWAELATMDAEAHATGRFPAPFGGPIVGPILLDPGSPAFDEPEKYGYTLKHKSLKEYASALSSPSWHQWLNYETSSMNSAEMVEQIFSTIQFSVEQRYRTGFYDDAQAIAESARAALDREAVRGVDEIMTDDNPGERQERLVKLKSRYDAFLNKPIDSFVRHG